MGKITIIFLLFGTLLFSENYPKEKIIRIIEKNEKYECVPDKKVRKIGWELNGQSFIGHLDQMSLSNFSFYISCLFAQKNILSLYLLNFLILTECYLFSRHN